MAVIIVGGGIGGLTLALSLEAAGIDCTVFESAPELRPLGVGINVLPHAVRELTDLGLGEVLLASGVATAELAYYSKHGRLIWSEPRGVGAGYRWPQVSIHRGTLHMLLLAAARERLGEHRIRLNHHLSGFAVDGDEVSATFTDRASGAVAGIASGSLLVGADGIHSAVRATFHPHEGAPRWSGNILWRGVTQAPPFLTGRSMIMAGYRELKFVCYPLGAPAADGRVMTNWIAERSFPRDMEWRREDWNRPAQIADVVKWFEDWRFDWLDVPAMIRAADYIYEFPMVDRDPLESWAFGRVTLLGDAAHPMYPIGSNGASQAILDARALTREILANGETPLAVAAYSDDRLPPTARIVLANRQNGPEQVMQIVEERAPQGFARLDEVVTRQELEEVAARYKQIAGFDRDRLNQSPPTVPLRRR